ncbi:glutamate ABC transporter substrate-binding protein [Nocardia sp. NPDC005978]|uniref:glutamate ABC transporter substrate-binding protein n=1 Tax=unclassified Nocardia TaxID=2637762 RepID=UPI0033BAEAA0
MSTRRPRVRLTLLAVAATLAAACGGNAPDSPILILDPGPGLPPGAAEITAAPVATTPSTCDPTASLRPVNQPRSGAMPAGSTMASIVESGKLRVGVDQNLFLFSVRNPATNVLEGFDIDIAKEISQDLFGDPGRVELHPIDTANRVSALVQNQVDLVVQTFSATCERRREIEFSSIYFTTQQRILTVKGNGIESAADLKGRRVCALRGTTTLEAIFKLPNRPTVIGMNNWLDCLTALQQGQVDAASTDMPILAGLRKQDPNLHIVGESLAADNYAVGVQKKDTDLVRFVNGVLERIRNDGTWTRLFQKHLAGELDPVAGPPAPRYLD